MVTLRAGHLLHSQKIQTVQQGWSWGVSSVGNPRQALTGFKSRVSNKKIVLLGHPNWYLIPHNDTPKATFFQKECMNHGKMWNDASFFEKVHSSLYSKLLSKPAPKYVSPFSPGVSWQFLLNNALLWKDFLLKDSLSNKNLVSNKNLPNWDHSCKMFYKLLSTAKPGR